PTGGVSFAFYNNGTCSGTGTAAGTHAFNFANSSYVAEPSSTESSLAPGSYSFNAPWAGDNNYNGATSGCEPFTVVQKSLVTDTQLCTFDDDTSAPGKQFRLIFTPDVNAPSTYKLNSSNPGQYYYNAFFNDGTSPSTIHLTIPYPFVTQGATPIHVY